MFSLLYPYFVHLVIRTRRNGTWKEIIPSKKETLNAAIFMDRLEEMTPVITQCNDIGLCTHTRTHTFSLWKLSYISKKNSFWSFTAQRD